MAKHYEVLLYATASAFARVTVEADNEEEAKELAESEYGMGDFEIDDIEGITDVIVESCDDDADSFYSDEE
jgi:hypothetical protein